MSTSKTKINFGTDGWRGVIGEDFTFENLGRLAYRIVDYIGGDGGSVCVGYDNRFMSPEYAKFFAAVFKDKGLKVDIVNKPVPTPCVSHRTNRKKYDLGVMVSASHNPPHYNGIKIKENYGGSAREEAVNSIIENLNETVYDAPTWSLEYSGDFNDWESEYTDEFMKILPENDLKVVCDYMHGSGYPYFDDILKAKGYSSVALRANRDPLFGGHGPEPKPATLGALIDRVKEEGADIGFAFDGDSDRIAVVDENGRLLTSQIILAVLAYDLLSQGRKGSIVKTVAGTYLIDRLTSQFGAVQKVVPIGFKNICPEILKGGVLVAGEESGGIGFGDYLPERDSINTAVRILAMLSRIDESIGDIWDTVSKEYGNSVYLREDFGTTFTRSETISKVRLGIKNAKFPGEIDRVSDLDGVRIDMRGGQWLLIRPSGTEPVIRVYAEAESEEVTRELINVGKEIIS